MTATCKSAISAFRLIKNVSINLKSVEFHQCHAKTTFDLFFFYHNIKDNERNFCQDLLTIQNTDSDLNVHALHYANELLVRVRLSFQKLLQNRSTYRNNTKTMLSNDAYSLSIRVQTTVNHISIFTFLCFIRQWQRQRKCFLSEREQQGRLLSAHARKTFLLLPFCECIARSAVFGAVEFDN